MLLAGVQDLKTGFQPKLVPAGFRPGTCWNDEGGILSFVVTLRVMGVRGKDMRFLKT
jgi:hypothetical protein